MELKKLAEPVHDVLEDWPQIALCIPVGNSKSTILQTLKSVRDDFYPKKRITLIIYDNSTDSSSQIVRDFIDEIGSDYRAAVHKREIPPSLGNIARARNKCFQLARMTDTQFVFSIDSDVTISTGTMEVLVTLLRKDSKIGMVCVPYIYLGDNPESGLPEVDITLGATMLSRKLLNRIDWTIDERYAKADDLWLGAVAERLGFRVVRYEEGRATHLKAFNYRTHIRKRIFEVPRYHYLLVKEGLLTRRLKRTYIYYSAYLVLPALALIWPILLALLAPLLGLGIWHHRSARRFLRALPVGVLMILGFCGNALGDAIMNLAHLCKDYVDTCAQKDQHENRIEPHNDT